MLGQHMQEGIHFNETHAPVPSVTCVRIILAITAATRPQLTQLDIKTAFLNAPLDIELDVILPDGFGTGSDDDSFKSYEARRRRALTAIPGCPQGSRVWRQRMVAVLNSLGYSTFLPDEPCLFRDQHDNPIFLVLWVDDIIECSPHTAADRRSHLHAGLLDHFPHGVKISPESTKVFHLGLRGRTPEPRRDSNSSETFPGATPAQVRIC